MATPSAIAPAPPPRHAKVAIAPLSIVSSPASSLSPTATTPGAFPSQPLAIKPSGNGVDPQSGTANSNVTLLPQLSKTSITSKEWVIPPRPKPGRKPATDTPPTKRKAQNRAAQRAFRERRAARVGELEEQLEDQREEHEQIEQELQEKVAGLDAEVQTLRSRCALLEDLLEKERAERTKTSNELDALRSATTSRHASLPALSGRPFALSAHQTPRSSITSTLSDHRNSTTSFPISQIISPPDISNQAAAADFGCGSCGPNGSCACVEEALANTDSSPDCGKCSLGARCECLEAIMNTATQNETDLKRKSSAHSIQGPEEKRLRPEPNEYEIDFTAMFSKKPAAPAPAAPPSEYHTLPPPPAIPPRDSCGFCTEGTYCMCAEAAAAAAAATSQATLAPIGVQVQTPPASEDDVVSTPLEVTSTGAIKLPRLSSLNRNRPFAPAAPTKSSGCGPNGPGSCAQCIADPKSGLFCRSLAAARSSQPPEAGTGSSGTGPSGGCCGGSAGGGGCCKSQKPAQSSQSPAPPLSLSCADAYKTLASHRNFDRAADEIGTWLPQLKTVPHGSDRTRHPLEVEAASIMSVLKGFDVRFGRGA